jgi:hypothetical protein
MRGAPMGPICAAPGGLEFQQKEDSMASSNKRKTTMAKLNRERRLAERRLEKRAKKEARKQAAAEQANPPGDTR